MFNLEAYLARISHFLVGYRGRKHVTQKDLCDLLRFSNSTLSRLEHKKKSDVTLQECLNMASMAGLTLSEFFFYLENKTTDKATAKYPWQEEVLTFFAELSPKIRREILSELSKRDVEDREAFFELALKIASANKNAVKPFMSFLTCLVPNKKESVG